MNFQAIDAALAANAQCAPGILGRDRWAFTPIGELSFIGLAQHDADAPVVLQSMVDRAEVQGKTTATVLHVLQYMAGTKRSCTPAAQAGANVDEEGGAQP